MSRLDYKDLSINELCVLAQDGDKDALESLLLKTQKSVNNMAKRYAFMYSQSCLEYEDFCQLATIGILTAVQKFDRTYPVQFLAYASFWMMQVIEREVASAGYTIRLPQHFFDIVKNIYRFKKQNPDASEEELMQHLKDDDIRCNEKLLQRIEVMLDDYFEAEGKDYVEQRYLDIEQAMNIPETDAPSLEDIIYEHSRPAAVREALKSLTEREALVITKRFGLDGGEEQTLESVGQELQITRERVRQIEAKALRKLRHPSRAELLKKYM